jgi:hypothetical protein
MRNIDRRLRKLEESLARMTNDEGLSLVDELRARRRRRRIKEAEAAGEPFVEEPQESPSKYQGLSVVDILRSRQVERLKQDTETDMNRMLNGVAPQS